MTSFGSSYDPDNDPDNDDGEQAPKPRKQAQKRRPSGPRKPRQWIEVDEDGEPKPLDEDAMAKLREKSQNLCLWHLAQGPRTRKQLTDAMRKHGVPEDLCEEVLAKMEEYNYVNDADYAANYVRSRHEGNARKGASAIRYELARKGVESDLIAEALEQVTPESETENARILVDKKLASTRGLDRHKRVNRLVGMLARKGYPPGIAFQVIREAIDAEDPEDDDFEVESI